jgi:hypothetical protein
MNAKITTIVLLTLAISLTDRAQLHTICFSRLAFIPGDYGAPTFIPLSKVWYFFGFQYMRDIVERDAEQSIHRAEVMAKVHASRTDEQKAYLGKMKFGDFST